MKVLVFENNLMWSARLVKSLRALGHEAVVRTTPDATSSDAAVAIVNLGTEEFDPGTLVPALNAAGVYTIGHAGHKEGGLLELGHTAGCRKVATNSELTFKLESLLAQV